MPERRRLLRSRPTWQGAAAEIALMLAITVIVTLVVKTFLFQAFFIPSASMEQTLDIGDRVVISKLTPGPFALHRGDVVVFKDPDHWLGPQPAGASNPLQRSLVFVGLASDPAQEHLIKRVIGLPGDHVVCCDEDGMLTVNNQPIDESTYLAAGAVPSEKRFDVVVPAGQLWVMGDNRQRSADSRYHQDDARGGFVPIEKVDGRAYAVVWPLSDTAWLGTQEALQ